MNTVIERPSAISEFFPRIEKRSELDMLIRVGGKFSVLRGDEIPEENLSPAGILLEASARNMVVLPTGSTNYIRDAYPDSIIRKMGLNWLVVVHKFKEDEKIVFIGIVRGSSSWFRLWSGEVNDTLAKGGGFVFLEVPQIH